MTIDWNKPLIGRISNHESFSFNARLICSDFKGGKDELKFVIALSINESETIIVVDSMGKDYYENLLVENVKEKKTGWINLFRSFSLTLISSKIYSNRDLAITHAAFVKERYIDTVKIEWKE